MSITKGPWKWFIDDHSMATLYGPDHITDHVMSASACSSCAKEGESPFGKCTMPSSMDAKVIEKSVEMFSILQELVNAKGAVEEDTVLNKAEALLKEIKDHEEKIKEYEG